MKKFLTLALFISSGVALGEDKCLAACKELAAECPEQCVKYVKKKNPEAMPACLNQCKLQAAECERECANEGPKKR